MVSAVGNLEVGVGVGPKAQKRSQKSETYTQTQPVRHEKQLYFGVYIFGKKKEKLASGLTDIV